MQHTCSCPLDSKGKVLHYPQCHLHDPKTCFACVAIDKMKKEIECEGSD